MLNFIALGAGAGLMYLLDPDRGSRRRALVRDQLVHLGHEISDAVEVAGRDLSHRAQGAFHEARKKLDQQPVDDDVLIARVRAKMGRYVSHPHAIEVGASQGTVTLKGLVLSSEVEELVVAISHVPGVSRVINQLEPHQRGERVPSLQGGSPRSGEVIDLFQNRWAPATQFLVGLGGVILGAYGFGKWLEHSKAA